MLVRKLVEIIKKIFTSLFAFQFAIAAFVGLQTNELGVITICKSFKS